MGRWTAWAHGDAPVRPRPGVGTERAARFCRKNSTGKRRPAPRKTAESSESRSVGGGYSHPPKSRHRHLRKERQNNHQDRHPPQQNFQHLTMSSDGRRREEQQKAKVRTLPEPSRAFPTFQGGWLEGAVRNRSCRESADWRPTKSRRA